MLIILPALEMPESPGDLCPCPVWLWGVGPKEQCSANGCGEETWRKGLARPFQVGQPPCRRAKPGAIQRPRGTVPGMGTAGCPGDTQPAQATAQRGKDGQWVTRLVFSRREKMMPNGRCPAGLSARVSRRLPTVAKPMGRVCGVSAAPLPCRGTSLSHSGTA